MPPHTQSINNSLSCYGPISRQFGISWKAESFFQKLLVRGLFCLLFLITVITQSTIAYAETITNTASVSYSINGTQNSQSDSAQFNTDTNPGTGLLKLQKLANVNSAIVGQNIVYTLLISNTGNANQNNLKIIDILPTGLVYLSGSATLNNLAINNNQITTNSNQLNIDLGNMPANTSWNVKYQLSVSASAPLGQARNQASVISDTDSSSASLASVNIYKATTPPTPPVIPVKPLLLEKLANVSTAKVGESIRYTLKIKNTNSKNITSLNIEDTLPTGLNYKTGSALLNDKSITADTSNGLNFSLGSIPANAVWTLSYEVIVENTISSRTLVNQASLTAKNSKANSNTAKDTVNILDDEIILTKKAEKEKVNVGETLEYAVTISNPALHDLENLVIRDTLPKGFIYQADSAKINGQIVANNNIDINNNILQVSVATLAKAKKITLSYIVMVSDKAQSGNVINQVSASSDFASSETVTASVKVRTPSTINFLIIDASGVDSIIPVTSFDANQDGTKNDWQDISNITLVNGSNVTLTTEQPLVKAEEYSLSDPIVIEVIDLDQNENSDALENIIVTITIPGTSDQEVLQLTETALDSGIFRGVIQTTNNLTETHNGVLTIKDDTKINVTYRDEEDSTDSSATAALVVPETPLTLSKVADKNTAAIGELIRYTLSFKNTTGFNLPLVKISDTLPNGFKYIPQSAILNGAKLEQGINFNGRSLQFNLKDMPIGSLWTLEYVTKVSAGTQMGKSVNRAVLSTGNLVSNHASASVKILDDLMHSRNILTGRVYIGCETKNNNAITPNVLKDTRIYLETGRSVLSDKEGFWHMEGVLPGSHVLQLDEETLPSGYEAILCEDNTRHAGDAKSQFIDLQAGSLWHVDFHVKAINSLKTQPSDVESGKTDEIKAVEQYDKKYLKNAPQGFEVLWPKNNYVPSVASTKIIIKSTPGQQLDLILNGKKVSSLNYDGSITNKAGTVIINSWTGVDIDIKNRDNKLIVILKDKSSKEISRETRNIHFSGKPSSAELLADESILIADGKTIPVIALRIKDEDGFPMRANTHGYFSLENNNYQIKTLSSDKDKLNLNESIGADYKYHIKEDGIARIELNPTSQSGQLKLKLKFSDTSSKPVSVWLKPRLRKWILVGIAEGTLAHKTLSGNMQTLKDLDKSDEFYKRGRVAFFAKGQIKGKYLLTLAYDTHKQNSEVGSQLNGNLDPDAWYTIYADNSNNQYDAPSSRKLYLKIEKENYYTLFGDYHTGMTITELAHYERVLNGFKTEFNGKRISFKGFVSETSNNHHHTEIPGDGTSGLYHLTRSIIANSETVKIETRDRFHSDRILESRQLTRYQDYDIDYDAGTLYFKFPISGRDNHLNPNIIVVDFDTDENSNKSISAGGRISMKSFNNKLETGLSVIHEGRNTARDNQLIAADITYDINNNTKVHVEVAQSKTEQSEYTKRNAAIVELEKEIAKMEARIYYKKQDEDYGISSQASENGIEKAGAEVNYKLNNKTTIKSEISHEKNLANNNKRKLAEIGIEHRYKRYEATAGIRHTQEEFHNESNGINKIDNNIALLGASYTTKNNKITLRSNIEKNISSNNGSEISPDRVIVGVDVKIKEGLSVFAEHETTDNSDITTQNTRVGINKSLWKGAKARTSYTQERTDQSQRNYATLGLSQKIKITDKISANLSIDKAKTISGGQQAKIFNEDEPERQGTQRDDYTAFSVGLGLDDKDWSWTTRVEYRDGEIEDKISFLAGVLRRLSNGKSLSAKISYYDTDRETGESDKSIKLSLGSAWHPKGKDFVFLSRLDLIDEMKTTTRDINALSSNVDNEDDINKIIHNMHYNRKINSNTQVGFHHGIKYITENNGDTKHSTTVDTATLELRRDINKRVDIGVHAGYLRDWDDKTTESVAGVSLGVTPAKNAWVEFGYNFEGFNDKDFDKNNYKRKGPYVDFRYKFNQDSLDGKDLPVRRKPTLNTNKGNNSISKVETHGS